MTCNFSCRPYTSAYSIIRRKPTCLFIHCKMSRDDYQFQYEYPAVQERRQEESQPQRMCQPDGKNIEFIIWGLKNVRNTSMKRTRNAAK